MRVFVLTAGLMALGLIFVLGDIAGASGSWAVPRFTPTWDDLTETRKKKVEPPKAPPRRRIAKPTPPPPVEPVEVEPAETATATAAPKLRKKPKKPKDAETSDAEDEDESSSDEIARIAKAAPPPSCPEVKPQVIYVSKPKSAPSKTFKRKKYWWQEGNL